MLRTTIYNEFQNMRNFIRLRMAHISNLIHILNNLYMIMVYMAAVTML